MKTRGGWCIVWRAKAATDCVSSLTKQPVELLHLALSQSRRGFPMQFNVSLAALPQHSAERLRLSV